MAYEIKIEQFEGSMDLLLYLIKSNKVNIYDIPIAMITDQYLSTINQWQEMDMEVASEFIVMASRLIEIKSAMLLPRNESEGEDPREELVSQLIDYQIIKMIGEYFGQRCAEEEKAFYKDPEPLMLPKTSEPITINTEELQKAFNRIFAQYKADHTYRPVEKELVRDSITVEDKIIRIREMFKNNRAISFLETIDNKWSASEIVVTFQAILELYKTGELDFIQNQLFGEITLMQGGSQNENATDFHY